jgi:hypothetical protein
MARDPEKKDGEAERQASRVLKQAKDGPCPKYRYHATIFYARNVRKA